MDRRSLFAGALAATAAGLVFAQSPAPAAQPIRDADVPDIKRTRLGLYLTPQMAADVIRRDPAKVLFVDVRTRGEMQFVGWTPMIDGHVPFVDVTEFWDWDDKNSRFKLDANPTFSADVEALLKAKGLTKADKVIVMCRSGDRSALATNILAEAGFTNVWNQIEGFEGDLSQDGRRSVNGWKNAGLPWLYKLDRAKIYLKGN